MRPEAIIMPPPAERSGEEVRISPPDSTIAICEWTDNGPWDGPPPHVHHEGDEAWHILEGTLRFTLDGRTIDAVSGSTVYVPRGVPHTFGNPGPRPARYLIILSPDILGLIDDLHAASGAGPDAVRAIWRKHGSEIV